MRTLLAVLLLLLAGCASEPEEDGPVSAWVACPQWVAGPGGGSAALDVAPNSTMNVTFAVPAEWGNGTFGGNPLDLWGVEVAAASGGRVALVASSDGRPIQAKDQRAQATVFTSVAKAGGDTTTGRIDYFLSEVKHGAEARPGPLLLELRHEAGPAAHVELRWTPYARVCGVPA